MSELTCEMIEITHMLPHENADTLSITHVYNYPVIIKTDQFKVGMKAIYFPVDACLPDVPIFSFVWKGKEPTEKNRTIKAIRLRGVFSMGLCMPLNEMAVAFPDLNLDSFSIGQNMAEVLGVSKYEPPDPIIMGGENERHPGWFVHYTDIQNIRKYHRILVPGEEIVLTEKLHGCNGRYTWRDDRLYVGSHTNCKRLGGSDVWNLVATKLDLADRLKECPDKIFFGEIFGQVQGGYNYGLKGELSFSVFDVYDIALGRYIDYDDMCAIVDNIDGVSRVPEIYRGPWTKFEDFEHLADGDTMQGSGIHNREGFVLKPVKERFDPSIRRVILKLHGQDFLTGRRKKKKD